MPSKNHQRRVLAIRHFFEEQYSSKGDKNWFITIDHERDNELPPRLLGNHRPDFYAESLSPHTAIVGEAKSVNDFNKKSQTQISGFIDYLANRCTHPKQPYEVALILCVAYKDINKAKRYLGSVQKAQDITIHLIDDSGFDHYYA